MDTRNNPADLGTRPIVATKLMSSDCIWINGPKFLYDDFERYVCNNFCKRAITNLPEIKKSVSCNSNIVEKYVENLFSNVSSFEKLINVICYLLRFRPSIHYSSVIISAEERNEAYNVVFRLSQRIWFSCEISQLRKNKHVGKNSRLITFNTFS